MSDEPFSTRPWTTEPELRDWIETPTTITELYNRIAQETTDQLEREAVRLMMTCDWDDLDWIETVYPDPDYRMVVDPETNNASMVYNRPYVRIRPVGERW